MSEVDMMTGCCGGWKPIELGVCPGGAGEGLDGLTDLTGLAQLVSVDVLSIAGNDGLTSLEGAPDLKQMQEVVIVDNPMLPESAILAFLAQNANPAAATCFGDADACTCPLEP